MKLKHVLPVACIASLLAACGSTAHTTVETAEPTSTAVSAMDEALKHTSGWGEFDLSEYELPTKGTEHFSREQVDQVADDVVGLLQNQLSYQSAGSRNDVLDDVNAFVSDAPGELADYMKTKSQEDASDNDSPLAARLRPANRLNVQGRRRESIYIRMECERTRNARD